MTIKDLKKVIMKELILSKEVFLIGHNNIDLDAFASMAGFSLIAKKYKTKAYIIIDDEKIEEATKEAISKISSKINICTSKEIENLISNKSVLFVFDNNNKKRISIEDKLDKFKNIIVIDHHSKSKETIPNAFLYIDEKATSASEIVTALLYKFRIKVPRQFATIILGGIVLDTNNFMYKMTRKSFFYCYFLAGKGADIKEAKMYLKQDINEYINRSKIIANTKIINDMAIAIGQKGKIYSSQNLAKTADLLLEFKSIKVSFAIGYLEKNKVGISARSIKNINVGKLMESFGGGGSKTEAAAIIENTTIKKVTEELKQKIL